ncbi:MAG: flagellar biosynthesis repressor FlbT [Hyphomonadaceae bacterium]
MSGLVLALTPGEKFIVNGALMENGEKPSRIRIKDNNARVLRCSDALLPEDVNTPVKQVFFAVQLLITGDLDEDVALPAIYSECDALEGVFNPISPNLISTARSMIERGNYYSTLCFLKQVIEVEANLFAVSGSAGARAAKKVA